MVGSSILPACFYKGEIYFLFGKENSLADTPGWSDFGGGVDPGESVYQTAMREGGEELTGFLGNGKQIGSFIKKNGGVYKMQYETYHVHLFHLPYNADLVQHYNDNHQFLWERMNKQFLTNTKLFEKIEIKWFSLREMKKNRNKFRNFYRNVVDVILSEEPNIRKFLATKQSKSKQRATKQSESKQRATKQRATKQSESKQSESKQSTQTKQKSTSRRKNTTRKNNTTDQV
jgi:8-oxo-dGTP pyrophosphatase MutT (NUDIX family)